ncbi:hypothetical protein ELQ17_00240 [Campylobacter sp. US18a]|nr:hypothetical protein ELQ17_00240 [Campylobacter sp. US18a]
MVKLFLIMQILKLLRFIVEFIFLGREIFNRKLPAVYIDFSHAMDNMQNGHYLLRVASANTLRLYAQCVIPL